MRGCVESFRGIGVCFTYICRRLQVDDNLLSVKPAIDRRATLIAPSVFLKRR
jgi:hypothetical protein